MSVSCLPETGKAGRALDPAAACHLHFSSHARQRLSERTSLSLAEAQSLLSSMRIRSLQCFGSSGIQMLLAYDVHRHQFFVFVADLASGTVITVLTYEQALEHKWGSILPAIRKSTLHGLAKDSGARLITFDRDDHGRIFEAGMKVYAVLADVAAPDARRQQKICRLSRLDIHLQLCGIVSVQSGPKRDALIERVQHVVAQSASTHGLVGLHLVDKSGAQHRLERLPGLAPLDLEDLRRRVRWADLASQGPRREPTNGPRAGAVTCS